MQVCFLLLLGSMFLMRSLLLVLIPKHVFFSLLSYVLSCKKILHDAVNTIDVLQTKLLAEAVHGRTIFCKVLICLFGCSYALLFSFPFSFYVFDALPFISFVSKTCLFFFALLCFEVQKILHDAVCYQAAATYAYTLVISIYAAWLGPVYTLIP